MIEDNKGIVIFIVLVDLVMTCLFVGVHITAKGSILSGIVLLIYILIILGSFVIINKLPKVYIWADIIVILIIVLSVLYIVFHGMIPAKIQNVKNKHNSQGQELLSNIEHYELEFGSYYKSATTFDNYYEYAIEKFSNPQIITIKELNEFFPLNEVKKNPKSIEYSEFSLSEDERAFVYVSTFDKYTNEDIVFTYDELELKQENIKIRTHFEIIKGAYGDVGFQKLIVVSVIPLNQR